MLCVNRLTAILLLALPSLLCLACGADDAGEGKAIALPGGEAGIGFDDLRFGHALGKVIVPAGRTGDLDLVDPDTLEVTTIGGFSAQDDFGGGHGQGTTSADEGNGPLFAIDRDARMLRVVDPAAKKIAAAADLGGSPDYVRFVESTGEVWVTEPGDDRIEIFTLPEESGAEPVHAADVAVEGGPESLVVDAAHGRAYTHLWKGETVGIDLDTREIVARFSNGCEGSRGIALDADRGWLFAGCAEGKLVLLDLATGKARGSLEVPEGVDVIDYAKAMGHLYVPSSSDGTVSFIGVSDSGELTLLGEGEGQEGSHCAVADDRGHAFVCDPDHGQLIVFDDPY